MDYHHTEFVIYELCCISPIPLVQEIGSVTQAYPSPTVDHFNVIYTPSSDIQTLEIIDINEKTVLKQNIPQWSQLQKLDVSSLRPGMYLCRIKNNRMSSSCKFVKTQ